MLSGGLHHYDVLMEESSDPSMVVTQAAALAECDRNALDFGEFRIGCRQETGETRVRRMDSEEPNVFGKSGGAKFVSFSGS